MPTLVVHGTADPLFPVEHGVALADEIPGARLMRLAARATASSAADHDAVARAVLDHTAAARPSGRTQAAIGGALPPARPSGGLGARHERQHAVEHDLRAGDVAAVQPERLAEAVVVPGGLRLDRKWRWTTAMRITGSTSGPPSPRSAGWPGVSGAR